MKLTNPTDDELNAAFAEKVALLVLCDCGGWTHLIAGASMMRINNKCQKNCCPAWPQFTRSSDAVLPWLEKEISADVQMLTFMGPERKWRISTRAGWTEDGIFPRAAVIALLRAHGVEVEFTR